jgi:glycosyltransferase involved in cell wall biosynthesis
MQEYMALGVPVIISRLRAIEAYYDEASVCFFEPGNELDLARAIVHLYHHPRARYDLAENALKAYKRYGSSGQRKRYARLVQSTLANKSRAWSFR